MMRDYTNSNEAFLALFFASSRNRGGGARYCVGDMLLQDQDNAGAVVRWQV